MGLFKKENMLPVAKIICLKTYTLIQLSKTCPRSQDRYKLVDVGPECYRKLHFSNKHCPYTSAKDNSTIMYVRQFNWQALNTVKSSSV